MILIIGGAHQGKCTYARQLCPDTEWIDGQSCGAQEIFCCGGIYHFHGYIAARMSEGADLAGLPEKLYKRNPAIVIVTDEIGYGIVPVEKTLREYRETTGRICTEIARLSQEVYRVVCGIGTRIK